MTAPSTSSTLPSDPAGRERYPMAEGLLHYFPAALAAVSEVSLIGNEQHNPGQPMHWARGKSTNHADKIIRHLVDAGTLDTDGTRHSAKLAWRALALLQEELERAGAPLPRNARIMVEHRGEDAAQLNPAIDRDVAELIPDHAPPEAYAGD